MQVLAICPFCLKTISIEQNTNCICPNCGQTLVYEDIKARDMLVDSGEESREFLIAKDYFANTEFLSAAMHFKRALDANKNSYLSKYFLQICDIYLNESSPDFDLMKHAVDTIKTSTALLVRSGVSIKDKLDFISAALDEVKIIILNCLRSNEKFYESDIKTYRRRVISDLKSLVGLFQLDSEALMTYSPNVAASLLEIADFAIATCHKAVQSVAIGDSIFSPLDDEYKQLSSLNGDYCFFATTFSHDYDTEKYQPDYTQNFLLNDKVRSRFENFEEKNRINEKRHIIADIDIYNDILGECDKAVNFAYMNCFKTFGDKKYPKRVELIKDATRLLCRSLFPRYIINAKKNIELDYGKFVIVSEQLSMLNKFLTELDGTPFAQSALRSFYLGVYTVLSSHFYSLFDYFTKLVNKLKLTLDDDYNYYSRFLFNTACCTACALSEYVPYNSGKDKVRAKLVKICKQVCEEFLLMRDYKIDEIDGSNIYRPILDIYNAVLKENEE